VEFKNEDDMKNFVTNRLATLDVGKDHVYFSESKERI